MSRNFARLLAPLALLAAVLAIYLVARPQLRGSDGASSTSTSSTTSGPTTKTTKSGTTKARKPKKSYTVKPGDVLGSISDKTGVSIPDLLDYNKIDASNLTVGQKLKLTP